MSRERNATIAIRTDEKTKELLEKLVAAMSEKMGTKVTKTQAVEIAIQKAAKSFKVSA